MSLFCRMNTVVEMAALGYVIIILISATYNIDSFLCHKTGSITFSNCLNS